MHRYRALRGLNYAAGLIVLASGLWMLEAQQSSNFTGGKVTAVDEKPTGNIAHFRFDPGARTKWHSHAGGQIILVEEGVARTQVKGGPVIELHAGETIYEPPGVMHWHGAAPDQGGVQYNVARGTTTWAEEVTDKEYTAAPQKR
jgi:quercetin dioxygenase-like cupin family protein